MYSLTMESLIKILTKRRSQAFYALTMESLLKILTKRRSQAFYKLIDVHSVTNFIGESISSISICNIMNQ